MVTYLSQMTRRSRTCESGVSKRHPSDPTISLRSYPIVSSQ